MSQEANRSEEEWKASLSPDQYRVLREKGTERPFTGKYVNTKDDGTYLCAACGAELFTSTTKFDSGTGWPSFTEPANAENVQLIPDRSHFMKRTEQQQQVREQGTMAVIDTLLDTLLSEHTQELRPEVVVEARRLMDNPAAGFVGALEAMKSRPDATPWLGTIDVPTLVLVGDHDKPSPPEVARAMHEQIPGSGFTLLPNAGHLTNLEVPDVFNQALGDFLEGL